MSASGGVSSFDELFVQYGVTADGFKRPTVDLIWNVAVREAELAFGKKLTAPTQAEMQYVEAIILWTDTYFQSLESTYYSAFYETAQGRQLDRLLALMGYERLWEKQATGEVTFTAVGGTSGAPSDTVIPAGTRLTTTRRDDVDRVIFQTTEPAEILEGETEATQVPVRGLDPHLTDLELTDEQTGAETNVAAGALDTFYDPVQGVTSVTNPLPTGGSGQRGDGSSYSFVTGRDEETDPEYRRRYENAQALGGAATVSAIRAALRNAGDGSIVHEVNVEEQLEIQSDGSGGYTGREFNSTVVLDEDTTANREAVAQALIENRAAGIESVGSVTAYGELSDGTQHNVPEGFDIATDVEIYVSADILVTETFPSDGKAQIKENVVEIIGGVLAGGQRISGKHGGIGGDVYYGPIAGAIVDNDIPGILDYDGTSFTDAITLGPNDPPTGTSNVTVSDDEMAVTRPSSITINTTQTTPQ